MIVLKNKSLKWLRSYGCSDTLCHLLEKMNVKLEMVKALGAIVGFRLWSGDDLYISDLAHPEAVNHWLETVIKTINDKAVQEASVNKPVPANKPELLAPASNYASGGKPVSQVVRLRDAKAMYQRVAGTSAGSVYVVVAMTKGLKVAAKIDSVNQLSVRAECDGEFYNEYRVVLAKQGMKFNDKNVYMSGHYPCNDDASPGKVLGAILFGSGLLFETPMPNLDLVKEGSAS